MVPEAETEEDNSDGTREAEKPMMQGLKTAGMVFVAVLLAEITAPFVVPLIHGEASTVAPAEQDAAQAQAPAPVAAEDLGPAIYTPLDPPLLANFTDEDGETRYLQLGLQAMARDQAVIDAVQQHAPALRNAFLFLISNQSYREITTREGKERMRAQMLEEAREILRTQEGEGDIEQIYFTSFIVQ